MSDYAALTTAELLDLLYQEEDRVPLALIEEVVRRDEEALPRLRAIWQDEEYWYESQGGKYWMVFHVAAVLSLHGKPQDIPLFMDKLLDVFTADQEWVNEYLPALLEGFGEPIIEPLMDLIVNERKGYWDNHDYAQVRAKCAAGLVCLSHTFPQHKPRITEFIQGFYQDEEEDDIAFLSLTADALVELDRKRALHLLKAAYARNLISKQTNGSYYEYLSRLDDPQYDRRYDFEIEVLDFYEPEMIAERQARWAKEAAEPEVLYWEPGTKPPKNAVEAWTLEETFMPEGYTKGAAGNIVRDAKVGRNDPCPCGSGKKYKKCHGA
jgi:hypothetical protein